MANTLLESLKLASVLEAALAMNTSYDALRMQLSAALSEDLGVKDQWSSKGPWVIDVFPSQVVYRFDNATYRRGYSAEAGAAGADPVITLGKSPVKVHMAFMDNGKEALESVIITAGDGTRKIRESIVFDDTVQVAGKVVEGALIKSVPVKLIQAGWGSSAFYSKEVLKRDGAKTFPKGTHMYWNHQTDAEEAERPINDLSNLAAVLVEDAAWDDGGAKGPGLYSKAKVFSDYSTQVAEKGSHIGASINAYIKSHAGEAEGKSGQIADEFLATPFTSVDFVTRAGAGGAPIIATESERRADPPQITHKEKEMTDQEAAVLKGENDTLKAKVKAMEDQQNVIVAVATVASVLREADIPFKQSLLEMACANPVMKDGKPDSDWLKKTVEMLSDVRPTEAGKVKGLGRTTEAETGDLEKAQKRIEAAMGRMGMNEKGIKYALEVA